MTEELGETDAEQRYLAAFAGPNAAYYLRKWAPFQLRQTKRAGFNWAAFFLSAPWLAYRKMYREAAVLWGVIIVLLLLDDVVAIAFSASTWTDIVSLAVSLVCGVYGNRWYLNHSEVAVARARHEGHSGEALTNVLSQRGGTSLLAVFAMLGLAMAVMFAIRSFGMLLGT
ncbi:MAG: DUF2628 domain-containing protein [Mycobacterium sp.]